MCLTVGNKQEIESSGCQTSWYYRKEKAEGAPSVGDVYAGDQALTPSGRNFIVPRGDTAISWHS